MPDWVLQIGLGGRRLRPERDPERCGGALCAEGRCVQSQLGVKWL